MLLKTKQRAAVSWYNFINTVTKNKTTVEHADLGLTQWQVFAIQKASGVRQLGGLHQDGIHSA